jgi:sec-independent protein translocase protein TatA
MQVLLMLILGFSIPGGFEWIVILVAFLLFFGGKRIPELMKGIGKGMKGFKDGLKGLEDEINTDDSKEKKS